MLAVVETQRHISPQLEWCFEEEWELPLKICMGDGYHGQISKMSVCEGMRLCLTLAFSFWDVTGRAGVLLNVALTRGRFELVSAGVRSVKWTRGSWMSGGCGSR